MCNLTRRLAPYLLVAAVLALAAGAASAEANWPSLMRYTVGLSTADDSRYQTSLSFSGSIAENASAKIEGWWIGGTGDDRAFVGDAFVDYTRKPLYLAAGRKYVIFGPAGVLVSPGFFGGEAQLDFDRVSVQAIAGTLQFTPGSGTNRFNFFGTRAPSDERLTAVRVAAPLTSPGAEVSVKVGANWLDILDDTGTSVDLELSPTPWLTLYGEAADYDDAKANVYGVRLSDAATRTDGKAWIIAFYHRKIDIGFVPAAVGASSFFEDQRGWAGGLYHQLDERRAIGVFSDGDNAILTWFGNVPL